MKTIPTKEQVLDSLQTHKQFYRAARALRTSPPTLKKWMRMYEITDNRFVRATQEPKPVQEKKEPWYKRFFNHGKESK